MNLEPDFMRLRITSSYIVDLEGEVGEVEHHFAILRFRAYLEDYLFFCIGSTQILDPNLIGIYSLYLISRFTCGRLHNGTYPVGFV